MELSDERLEDGVLLIRLGGRFDLAGNAEIEHRFTALTATARAPIVVDLAEVSFLASIGMRTLIANAKAQARRGGRMVLLHPQPMVASAIETAGIDTLIPIYQDLGAARAAALEVARS
jgi:anti-anti-sigma factor